MIAGRVFLAALIVGLASPALAQSLGLGLGLDRTGKRGAGASPFVLSTGVYSFRKVMPAFAGAPIRLRRASDNAQQDIPFAGADFDTAAATTFCAATSCFVAKWYDQAPAAQDFSQAATPQASLLFNCLNGIPCVSFVPASFSLTAPSVSQTGVVTINVVMNRAAGTGICVLPQVSNNAIKTRSGVAGLSLQGSVGSINTSSADATWHSATGVINGASSAFAIDGTTTTGSLTGSATAAGPSIQGAASTTCNIAEVAFWQAYAMPAAEIDALNADQHAYWGF